MQGMEKKVRKDTKEASAAGDADGALCVQREGVLIMVLEVFVKERDVFGTCVAEGWEKRRTEG